MLLDQRLTDALHSTSWWWIIVGSKVVKVGWLFLPALFWTLLVASALNGIVAALCVGMFEDGGGGITDSSIPEVDLSAIAFNFKDFVNLLSMFGGFLISSLTARLVRTPIIGPAACWTKFSTTS